MSHPSRNDPSNSHPIKSHPLNRVQLSCLLVLGLGLAMSAGLWAVEVPACNAATDTVRADAVRTDGVTSLAVAEPALAGETAVASPATAVTPAAEPAFILVPQPCGGNTCGPGTFCCNRSCGICAPLGGFCTQQVCAPVE